MEHNTQELNIPLKKSMEQKSTAILITGGFGFIGLALARRILEKGSEEKVYLFGHERPMDAEMTALKGEFGERAQFRYGDVIDFNMGSFMDVNRVYHLAAIKRTSGGSSFALDENIENDENIVHAFGHRPEVKILYASTGEIFGTMGSS